LLLCFYAPDNISLPFHYAWGLTLLGSNRRSSLWRPPAGGQKKRGTL